MSALCRFDSPDFTRTLSGGGIPTFAVDPSNSNFLHAAGSFTNGYGSVCSFPTQYQLQKNTITPYLVLPGSTTTICTGGLITPSTTSATVIRSTTHSTFQCLLFTHNKIATGIYTLNFVEPTGPAFSPMYFVIASLT